MEFNLKEVDISQIKISDRQRKYIGDITSLKKSMKEIGLINPIVISDDYTLIAGYRRLLAAKELGWKKIVARVISSQNKHLFEDIEFDENYVRKNLFQEEIEEIRKSRDARKKGFFKKIFYFVKKLIS
ncbi:MAG: ParB N-terminal domain-containing protein [Brevinematia bacterium]